MRWGQIDLLVYSKAFTGPGSVKPHATCPIFLQLGHSVAECTFYSNEPAKRTRATSAGPRHVATSTEICMNLNQGKCLRNDYQQKHFCSFRDCGGPHVSLLCPYVKDCAERLALADRYLRRDSPYGIITHTKLRKCTAIYTKARRVLESST